MNFEPHKDSFIMAKHKGRPIIDKYIKDMYNRIADTKAEEYWLGKGRYTEKQH